MRSLLLVLLGWISSLAMALAQTAEATELTDQSNWRKKIFSLESGVLGTLVYTLVGILMLILAFKAKDILLPGKLDKQLVEDRNVAVAIVTAAFLLGIAIIIAAAIAS